jgi:iron-sulfur cluster repair protein YtfE (RIC family)
VHWCISWGCPLAAVTFPLSFGWLRFETARTTQQVEDCAGVAAREPERDLERRATVKRSMELRQLSEQHHHGLVAARRLRRAAKGEVSLQEAVERFLEAWRAEIRPHFRAEEELLLPGFARAVPPDDPLIVRTLTEHVSIRWAVGELQRSTGERLQVLAQTVGLALDDHIRFEERILFPAIEAALAGPLLAELARALQEVEHGGSIEGERAAGGAEGVCRGIPSGLGSV